jgi:hypothetical protein
MHCMFLISISINVLILITTMTIIHLYLLYCPQSDSAMPYVMHLPICYLLIL